MLLKTSTIEVRIVREEHNLPVVFDSFVSGKAKKKALASNMRSGLCHTRPNALDFFHDNDLGNLGPPLNSVLDSEHFSNFCGACVEAAENENISAAQTELLKWHWKLGIGIYRIQEMMHERHDEDPVEERLFFQQ